MALDINQVFDTHAKSLTLGSQRIGVLAANIANADTPNYKARDIDFKGAMQSVEPQQLRLAGTRAGHISTGDSAGAPVLYRNPDQPSEDGNTVDSQKESAAVAETALRYQASLSFLNMRIRGLKLAITGSR